MIYNPKRLWNVRLTNKAVKQLRDAPSIVQEQFDLLAKEMETAGPLRHNWRNFGRLKGKGNVLLYHCHIKSGRPTYVACWQVVDKNIQFIEVYYVGTHEKAPY